MGYIFQNYSLISELTVRENILLGLKEWPERNKEMDRILKLLDLSEYANHNAFEMSGGQQQRVAIARALLKDSKIIVADEPTGNLDSENGQIVFRALKKISKDHLVIIVTHDYDSAEKYADRIISISDGSISSDTVSDTLEEGVGCDIINEPESYLTLSDAVAKSRKLIKSKKMRMTVSVVISIFLLSILGISVAFNNFDFEKMSAKILNSKEVNTITLNKGYIDKKSGNFVCASRAVSNEEIEKFTEENHIDNYDESYLVMGLSFYNGSSGNEFITSEINTAIISSEIGLEKYDLSLCCGYYPEGAKEICVTDYMLYNIFILNPSLVFQKLGVSGMDDINDNVKLIAALKTLDTIILEEVFGENWEESIAKSETLECFRSNPGIILLNSDIDMCISTYKITGIINTGFTEKYKELIYMDQVDLNNDSRTETLRYLVFNGPYMAIFVSDQFINSVYEDKIIFNNAAIVKYSQYSDKLNVNSKLKGNDIYVSTNYFRAYFREEFNPSKIGQYTMPNTISMPLGEGMKPDVVFESDSLNVIGVFDMPYDYEEKFSSSMAIITSDDYFVEFAKSQFYRYGISFNNDRSISKTSELLKNMSNADYYYSLPYSFTLYDVSGIIAIFNGLSWALALVIIALTIVLITSCFTSYIKDQQNNIGIMRAMGADRNYITKIYMSGAMFYVIMMPVGASLLFVLLSKLVNNLLSSNIVGYFNAKELSGLTILNLDWKPFASITIVGIFILIISVIISIRKLTKVEPINIIKR